MSTAKPTEVNNSNTLAYISQAERWYKIEMALVALLWIIGCPLLSSLPSTSTGSLWGSPNERLCGLYSYSHSASMSGHYSKAYGSVMAPLFAVLVVQRTSNGLCSMLKLGWLARFSPFVSSDRERGARSDALPKRDAKTYRIALKLWKQLERIEFLGYLTGGFLVSLVAFDTKYFPHLHDLLATLSFFSLFLQNYMIGSLGKDFPDIFPNWTFPYADRIFLLGWFHFTVMGFFLFPFFGTIHHFDRCNDFLAILDSFSIKVFGNPETMRWLSSMALWYNEYAFGLMCFYVQLLEHYETQLWEFVGEENLPYAAILSRFSIGGAILRVIGGFQRQVSEVDLLMGISESSQCANTSVPVEGKKVKTG